MPLSNPVRIHLPLPISGPILVTGAAGFIGSHLTERLLRAGHDVVGLDNLNDFYDPVLKAQNLAEIHATAAAMRRQFTFYQADIRDQAAVLSAVTGCGAVVHLAAAAGVRPSIEQPLLYQDVNLRGTLHVLEAMRTCGVTRLVFASSSSVYGNHPKVPFSEADSVDHPISPYAATKKAGELLCHTWHHLHHLSVACLRFFTVYGPRQRPDLAISKFTGMIGRGEAIPLFGDGTTSRDYTYVDDTVQGVLGALQWVTTEGRFGVFNLGNAAPVTLRELVAHIEIAKGRKAQVEWLPMQAGDVERTCADITLARAQLGYDPAIPIAEGMARYVAWHRQRR